MHVLALVTDAFGGRGGIARYNRDFISALAASDAVDSVTVLPRLCPEAVGTLPTKVEQTAAVLHPARYSMQALLLGRRLPEGSVLFCGHLLMSPLAAIIAQLTATPLWLQVHGIDAWPTPCRLVRWGAGQATLVTSVSRYTKSRMSAWFSGNPSQIRVLPNTVGSQFSPAPKPPELLNRYGLMGKKVILTVSRLNHADRHKGHDRVIAALPEIVKRHPDAIYLIVGAGNDVGRLQSLAVAQGVAALVVFAGHVSESELPAHFRVADAFIMPSTKEGFGIVFLEAALSGLPVIGGNRDGSADALADGQIGRLIDPAAREQIESALIEALDGPRPCRTGNPQRFAFEHFAHHVDQLVKSLVRH